MSAQSPSLPDSAQSVEAPETNGVKASKSETSEKSKSSRDSQAQCLLTKSEKRFVGLAVFGNVSLVFTLSFAMTVVWMRNFGLDGKIVGAMTITTPILQVVVAPIMGRWSDEGRYNICCFKNTQYWGRRSPMALLSVPLGVIAVYLQWGLPEGMDGAGVVVWFVTAKLVTMLSVGCMYNSASMMAFGEVLPNKAERLTVATYQTLGVTLAWITAATMTAVAVSVKVGSDSQTRVFLGLAGVNILLWLLVVPWCLTMRKTVERTAIKVQQNLVNDFVKSLKTTPGFSHVALFNFFFMGGTWLTLGMGPFFLEYVMDLERDNVAAVTAVGFLALLVGRGIAVPITNFLIRDREFNGGCCCSMHPARLLPFCIVIGALQGIIVLNAAAELKGAAGIVCFILHALKGGLVGPIYEISNRLLIVWVIDCDLVEHGRSARRDGHFQSLILTGINFAWIFLGFAQLVLGSVGFVSDKVATDAEGEDASVEQPNTAKMAIWMLVANVAPLLWIIGAVILYQYPLQGKRLDDLRENYARVYEQRRSSLHISQNTQDDTNDSITGTVDPSEVVTVILEEDKNAVPRTKYLE